MKIVVVGTRGFPNIPGGIEKHCEELYPRLAALGCDVTVVTRTPYTGKKPYTFKGVNIHPIPCPKHKYFESIVHTFFGIIEAKKLKADILHIHAIGPSLLVPLARLLGLKVVMTHHGPDYDRQKWNHFAKKILKFGEKLGVNLSHQLIVISQTIAQTVRQKFGRDEFTVIPNGVIVADRSAQGDALKSYQLESQKYILAVGRFVPEKGFHELVESFQNYSSTIKQDWKLVIVGDADHEDEFSRNLKIKGHKVPNVVLTGFQTGPILNELYSHAGLFVLPSYHEGLPIVLLEALSYGTSCLVSDIPANREVDLENERYFQPGDISTMTQKLTQFLKRAPNETEYQERIQHIANKYDWYQIAKKTLAVYEELLPPAGGWSLINHLKHEEAVLRT